MLCNVYFFYYTLRFYQLKISHSGIRVFFSFFFFISKIFPGILPKRVLDLFSQKVKNKEKRIAYTQGVKTLNHSTLFGRSLRLSRVQTGGGEGGMQNSSCSLTREAVATIGRRKNISPSKILAKGRSTPKFNNSNGVPDAAHRWQHLTVHHESKLFVVQVSTSVTVYMCCIWGEGGV